MIIINLFEIIFIWVDLYTAKTQIFNQVILQYSLQNATHLCSTRKYHEIMVILGLILSSQIDILISTIIQILYNMNETQIKLKFLLSLLNQQDTDKLMIAANCSNYWILNVIWGVFLNCGLQISQSLFTIGLVSIILDVICQGVSLC